MANQMPAEMRATAKRLRVWQTKGFVSGGVGWEDFIASADALDALADVVKVYEAWFSWTDANDTDEDVELLLSDISMAIHGENFTGSSERG